MNEPRATSQEQGAHQYTEPHGMPPPNLQPPSAATRVKILITVGVLLALVGAAFVAISWATREQAPYDAWQACQDHARAQLDRPETATFASFEASRVVYVPEHYNVSSSVTAQSSANAQIQASFTCEVEHARAGRYKITRFDSASPDP